MTENIRKKNYIVEQFTITSDNIDKFVIVPYRRQISATHVSKIHGSLLAEKNPVGILIVNQINNEMRLIDGNHRIEAIKRFFNYKDSNKKIKIECVLKVYKGLSEDEEKQIYSDEAKRKNESYEDRLNIYKDSITFWKLMNDPLNKFPSQVTIYPAKNSIKFRTIINALNTTKQSGENGYNANYLNKEEIIQFALTLQYEDYKFMHDFVGMFVQIFGKVGTENIFSRPQYFLPLFDIYCKNIKCVKDSNFYERFSKVISRADLMNYMNVPGREAQSKIRDLMIGYMNHKISRNLFV